MDGYGYGVLKLDTVWMEIWKCDKLLSMCSTECYQRGCFDLQTSAEFMSGMGGATRFRTTVMGKMGLLVLREIMSYHM